MKTRVLVADDEKRMADILAYALRREGYEIDVAYDGDEALSKIYESKPNIALLDVMMPKISGYDICRQLSSKRDMGIILLTAKNDIVDKVLGMELGADDYITKPFDIREVLVRVKTLLRRLPESQQVEDTGDEIYQILDLQIDKNSRDVKIKNKSINLTVKEFDLLYLLFDNKNRVFTRDELLELVWGIEYLGGTRTVDIHIQRIRQKFGKPYNGLIKTIHRVGYKAVHQLEETS